MIRTPTDLKDIIRIIADAVRAGELEPFTPRNEIQAGTRDVLEFAKDIPDPESTWPDTIGLYCGEYGHSWMRDSAQIADYNSDGRIDYLRIQDPPRSYRGRVWIDHDRDGYFDREPGVNEEDIPGASVDLRVPEFAPLSSTPRTTPSFRPSGIPNGSKSDSRMEHQLLAEPRLSTLR